MPVLLSPSLLINTCPQPGPAPCFWLQCPSHPSQQYTTQRVTLGLNATQPGVMRITTTATSSPHLRRRGGGGGVEGEGAGELVVALRVPNYVIVKRVWLRSETEHGGGERESG